MSWLRARFGIDTRGLAAFRIALGVLVLIDLIWRTQVVRVFYTDAGPVPRALLADISPALARYSLHAIFGTLGGQLVLFGAAGVCAVAMTLGYWTRYATTGTAMLQASLYARNPYVLNGGDGLLLLALFLGIFLPLGARWSIDALHARDTDPPPTRMVSVASVTLLLQLVVVYLANAGFKLQSDPWVSGVAIQYVLELEHFSILLGPPLTAAPWLLTIVTYLWLGLLVFSPLLVVTTGIRRTLIVAAFMLAHFGMFVTMYLGLFPIIVIAILLPYLPGQVWDSLEAALLPRITAKTAGGHRFLRRHLPGRPAPTVPPGVRRSVRVSTIVLLAVFLAVSILWPATALGLAGDIEYNPIPKSSGYTWTLFAPTPPTHSQWFIAPVTYESGDQLDAFDGSAVDVGPPSDAATTYENVYWQRYLGDIRDGSTVELQYLADYLCQKATTYREDTPKAVSVYVVLEPVNAVGGGEPRRQELYSQPCPPS